MEETKVKVKPKTPKLVTRVYDLQNLQDSAEDLSKNSKKLRRIFEKNTYQKKTQLSVLKRYKRRIDSIEKAEEERRKKSSQKKIKLPDIKKFAGSFFAPDAANDPLKAIGALAAFKSLEKVASGDFLGAIAPGLVAAGMVAGPGLIGAGIGKAFEGIKSFGSKKSVSKKAPNTKPAIKSPRTNLKSRSPLVEGGRASKAFTRLGKSIIPGVGAVLGAVDAKMRAEEGDITGARISGASAALDVAAAASAATGIGLVATPFLGLASMTLDLINFARDITGMSENESKKKKGIEQRLQEQTKKEKDLVRKSEESKTSLSFERTLIGYEKVVNKFEEFSKIFQVFKEETLEQTQKRAANIENLVGNQEIIAEPGYEFTEHTAQYLTGDPNSPAYDESHGTSSNYHDHIAFNDRQLAIRAYQYLESKGLDVTEFEGFDPVGGHSSGSYHYSGLAFDVPGYQWGATGPIDQRHYNGSRLVRKYLNEFFQMEKRNNPNMESKNSTERRNSSQRMREPNGTQIPARSSPSTQNNTPVRNTPSRPNTREQVLRSTGIDIGPQASNQQQSFISSVPQPKKQIESYTETDTFGAFVNLQPQQQPQTIASAPPSQQLILNNFSGEDWLNRIVKIQAMQLS